MFDYTKCDAVMIARGAQGNPFIFEQTNEYLKTGSYRQIPLEEKEETLFYHLDLLIKYKGEHIGIREFRKHAAWYIKGLKDSALMRGKINTISNCYELKKELENYFKNLNK